MQMTRLKFARTMGIRTMNSKNLFPRYSFPILFFLLVLFHYTNISAQDWVITDTVTLKDTTIVLNGNLIIKDNGSLTLNSAKINVNCQFEGQYGVFVSKLGSLYILNQSEITKTDNGLNYAMVCNGREFKMQNSKLSGVGWGIFEELQGNPDNGSKGLFITSPNTVIDSSEITDCYIGLNLACDSAIVTNNKIHLCTIGGIKLFNASDNLIKENWIKDDEAMGLIEARGGFGNKIINNQLISPYIDGATQCLRLFGTQKYLIDGNFMDTGGAGIWLWGSDNNTIINNTIHSGETALIIYGWNNHIENNTLDHHLDWYGDPIYMTFAYNTRVINNRILNLHYSDHSGIWLRHSSNNLIMGNEIQALPPDHFQTKSRGIFVTESCCHNILHSNKIDGSSYGIFLSYSSNDNKLYNNEVVDIRFHGIVIDDADSNIIFNNNKMTNIGMPPFDDGNNSWNYSGAEPEFAEVARQKFSNLYENRITGQEVIENQTLNFHFAELAEGASLVIRNSTLIMGVDASDISYIDLQPNSTLEIYDSKILHHKYGGGFTMDVGGGSNFILKNSEIKGAGHEWWYNGIFIMSDNSLIEDCTFYETSIIYQSGGMGGRFVGNKVFHSYAGIFIHGETGGLIITDNTIDGAIRNGISAHDQNSYITVRDNQIKNIWGDGLVGHGFKNSTIENNTISNISGHFSGINSLGSNSKALNNQIQNSHFGIYNNPENVEIRGNNISQCNIGYLLREFGQSTLFNNITDCNVGVYLNADFNSVKNLVIADCDTGIYISENAKNNVVFSNDFLENETQAVEMSTSNSFYFEGVGNFWSDYIGVDENSDGIGDTPYRVQNETYDNFPLMSPSNINIEPIFLLINSENTIPSSFSAGDTNLVIAKFTMQITPEDSAKTATLLGFSMDRTGSGEDSDISMIKIWQDSDNNESFSASSDSIIGHGVVTEGSAKIFFYNEEQISFVPNNYFISIDIAATISGTGNTIGFSCKDSTYFITKFPARVKNTNFPLVFNEQTLPVQNLTSQPLTFSMEQNYPNPFNNATTIPFSVKKQTKVRIRVFNILGHEVERLVDEVKEPGYYHIIWDCSNTKNNEFSSGLFFIKLETENFTKTIKTLVIK